MKKTMVILFLLLINTYQSLACFGTELIIGYDERDSKSYYVASLLELYIKEKTGIDTKLLPLNNSKLNLISEEKVDLIVYPLKDTRGLTKTALVNKGEETFFYRTKIKEDLRFSTLEETLKRLSSKLTKGDLLQLFSLIEKKGKTKRTIKEFLTERSIW